MNTIKILNVEAKSGEKAYGRVPVAELPDGNILELPLHVANGRKPGPTMLIINALHGDAAGTSATLRRFYMSLDPEQLSGVVAIMPVCNPLGAAGNARHTPQDGWNMNRVFPAKPANEYNPGWVTQMMAEQVDKAIQECDILLDFHSGSDTVIHYMWAKTTEPENRDKNFELAQMVGFKYMYAADAQFDGTSTEYAISLGKEGLLVEHGGIGLPDYCREEAIRGVFNILKYKGMMSGKPDLPKEQIVIRKGHRTLVRPHHGGWFIPEVGSEKLDDPMPKGTVLGRVINLYNFKELEVLRAPYEESIPLMMKVLPGIVYPGDYGYIIAEGKTAMKIKN